jgi:hypothetical protein
MLLTLPALLPYLTAADGPTGGDCLGIGSCPGGPRNSHKTGNRFAAEETLVYSPFKPYWRFDVPYRRRTDAENCRVVVCPCLFPLKEVRRVYHMQEC